MKTLFHLTGIRSKQGFTLVELLVAMAVLSLIILVIAQIFNTSSIAISQNSKNMNALDSSEAMLQQVGLDVSRMLLRDDIDYSFVKVKNTGTNPGNDFFSFYARTPGLSATGLPSSNAPRPLSVVQYQVVQNPTSHLLEMQYGALQIDWDNAGTSPFVLTSSTQLLSTPNTLPAVTTFTPLAPEVVRMELCFVLVNDPVQTDNPPKLLSATPPAYISASNVPYPIRNVAGILIGIVVIDPKSRALLPAGVDLKVAQLFPDAVADQDLLSLWAPLNMAAKLQAIGVPTKAVPGVRIYQKYFPLRG